MEIKYTEHAIANLEERKIEKDVVEELLRHPQQVIKGKGDMGLLRVSSSVLAKTFFLG